MVSVRMPNRLHRYYGAGYLHFITTSCYQRRALLGSRKNRDLFLNVTRFTETISALARTMAQREPVVFAPAKRDPGQDSRAALARNRLVRAVVAEALLTAVLLGLGILAVIQPAMIKRILSKFSRTSGRFFWWRC